MTDEAAFQGALNDDPTNSSIRLVFADWLEEQGDPRAAGYRWMGEQGKCPYYWAELSGTGRTHDWYRAGGGAIWDVPASCTIPDWLWMRLETTPDWVSFASRRAAEEALCFALNQDPMSRKQDNGRAGEPERRRGRH